jgi:hypothetical protein
MRCALPARSPTIQLIWAIATTGPEPLLLALADAKFIEVLSQERCVAKLQLSHARLYLSQIASALSLARIGRLAHDLKGRMFFQLVERRLDAMRLGF